MIATTEDMVKGIGAPGSAGAPITPIENGAGNGGRTRDLKLGKLALYQLSYARE